MSPKIILSDWSIVKYAESLERQKTLFNKAIETKLSGNGEAENVLVLCEHPNVITFGKHAKESNLLFSEEYLKSKGIECFRTDRGGDITYHGPGQIVGYPVFDLDSFGIGLKEYIYRLEEVIISLLEFYNIRGEHLNGASGVWIDADRPAKVRKICAIGVRCSRFVTMHGFALNVNTDLDFFNLINPCGFTDRGVTSIEKELGRKVSMEEVKRLIYNIFCKKFS